ncbi:hypothetical protein GCM10029992_36130 [Glycomyces albus]
MNAPLLLLSASAGLGMVMVATAIWPWRPPLATALATFDATGTGTSARGQSLLAGLGIPSGATRADLACLGRTEGVYRRHTGRTMAAVAAAGIAVTAILAAAGSGLWPLALAVGAATTVATPLLTAQAVHRRAEADRAEYRRIISLIEDLVAVDLDGGAGIDSALHGAITAGKGPHFRALRSALDQARLARLTVWEGLEAFGRRIGVAEYRDLAATVGLAANEGGEIREAMTSRADTTLASEAAAAEATHTRMTEHMSLAIVFIVGAILTRVVAGALIAIFTAI